MTTKMKIATPLWIAAIAMMSILGCGNAGITNTAGSGGNTSTLTTATSSTTSSSTTTTTTTGSGGAGGTLDEILGYEECPGDTSAIGPIVGETALPDGTEINEDHGLAIERFVPPSYPWLVTSWSYTAVIVPGTVCTKKDHSAVYAVVPAKGDLPLTWPGAVEVQISAASLTWEGNEAIVSPTMSEPVLLTEGQAFVGAAKYSAMPKERSCFQSCDGTGADPNAFYSSVNMSGTVDDCPAKTCAAKLLSESPDPAAAHMYGNDDRSWRMSVHGHAAK